MKHLLLSLLAALALPTAVNSGIPKKFEGKYMKATGTARSTYMINTEDIDIKRERLRFYVKSELKPSTVPDPNIRENWEGKLRINCKNFEKKKEISIRGFIVEVPYSPIKENEFSYILAENFCFLTGVEGYTAEKNPPQWVKKIIRTIREKSI